MSEKFSSATFANDVSVDVASPSTLVDSLIVLEQRLEQRVRSYLGEAVPCPWSLMPQADSHSDSYFDQYLIQQRLDDTGQTLLTLALFPWVMPDLIDSLMQRLLPQGGELPFLGGVRGTQHRAFLPTGDTALALLAGHDTQARLQLQAELLRQHPLIASGAVRLLSSPSSEPPMSGRLAIDEELAHRLLTGDELLPTTGADFPAEELTTDRQWDELVLPTGAAAEVAELHRWVCHRSTLMDDWAMRAKLRPGCRALFFGPPGTGKTLTATLLGKLTAHRVFRIDLSLVVSKYIGETEKNLSILFDKAERRDWILFFDEADALFGKRGQTKDSRDRYANQEVSYLLQRIECFDGLIILASNFESNVDQAFGRRFEHMIHFPLPGSRERLTLWQNAIPTIATLEPGLNLSQLANEHPVSGGTIMNVVRHACLAAIARGTQELIRADINEAFRREYVKENRVK